MRSKSIDLRQELNMNSIIIIVFDGLQPSQIDKYLTPNLFAFKNEGVFFTNHHPIFPSVTRANAASLVTGRYPGAHGLTGNTLVVPEFMPYTVIPALESQLESINQKTGQVLLAPTIADILGRANKKYIAIGTGTSGNAYIHNPRASRCGGATIHPDFTLPRDLNESIIDKFGEWPIEEVPNIPRLRHSIKVMQNYILEDIQPEVALLWSSEPDKSQHAFGVGSEISNRVLHEADKEFGVFWDWLRRSNSNPDIMIVSDHGYSTIQEVINVRELLDQSQILDKHYPKDVSIAGNGGSVLFYTQDHDPDITKSIAHWLMSQYWCGSLTASKKVGDISGTLPNSIIGLEGDREPDLTMSFRWDSEKNLHGYPGFVYSTSGDTGLGQHGSLSAHEMANVLLANGPSFKNQTTIDNPTGNIDIAPTILNILGIDTKTKFDGRILDEALLNGVSPENIASEIIVHSADHKFDKTVYRQMIKLDKVGTSIYPFHGNAYLGPR